VDSDPVVLERQGPDVAPRQPGRGSSTYGRALLAVAALTVVLGAGYAVVRFNPWIEDSGPRPAERAQSKATTRERRAREDRPATGSVTPTVPTPASDDMEGFTPYKAQGYTARLPEEWEVVQDDAPQGDGRRVTKAVSPDGDSSVVIDTTPGASGDPADSAETLESGAREDPSYERRRFGRVTLGPTSGFEWAYEQDDRHKVDVLFFTGEDGYGVVAEGPPARAESLGSVARTVAESVRSS